MMHSLYRFYAEDDTLLYVGQSRNPFQRLAGHFTDKDMPQVRHIEIEWFDNQEVAIKAESWAIRRENPLWNVMAPIKPRKARKTPVAAYKVSAKPAVVHGVRFQGPPAPWKHFGVGIHSGDIDGLDLDFSFTDCEAGIKRALKVSRRGDVLHVKKGAVSVSDIMAGDSAAGLAYVQFH